MGTAVEFKADFNSLFKGLKLLAPELSKELRTELVLVAAEVRDRTRGKVPHNMKKTGVKSGFIGRSGAYVKASGPVGAYDGARRNSTFRHPVFPQSGTDRSTWNWASQACNPILEDTWDEMGTWAGLKSEEAIQRAVDSAFGDR